MKANRLTFFIIVFKIIYFTLKITFSTLYRSYCKTFQREYGDELMQWWSSRILDVVKLDYKIINQNAAQFIDNRAYIIMSNHQSLFDIPLIYKAFIGTLRMVAKKELFDVPVWGRGLVAGEFINVDRRNRKQSIDALKIARMKMESGIRLWISPEGTRSLSSQLLNFKKGGFLLALQTNAIIIPVGIRGSREVLAAKSRDLYLNRKAEVHIGTPIDSSHYSIKELNQLIENVRNQITELANVGVTIKD